MSKEFMQDRLTPYNSVVVLIDYQVQFALTIPSKERRGLTRNAVSLAKTARMFSIPTVLTTIGEETFGGPLFPKLAEVLPEGKVLPRLAMSIWEDDGIVSAIETTGRNRLVMAGLWTDFSVALSAIQALERGYDVVVVTDVCGDLSPKAHYDATQRMIRAGAVPMTWLQVFLELEYDPDRKQHNDLYLSLVKEHAGAYGLDIEYPLGGLDSKRGRKITKRI